MPKGTKTQDSFAETMRNMLQELAIAKVAPDADLRSILELESRIVAKLREPHERMMAMQQSQMNATAQGLAGGGAFGGATPGAGMGVPAAGSATQGMGVRGLRRQSMLPPVDELRRLVTNNAGS